MTPPDLDEVLAHIQQLPSLPAVVRELIETLDKEEANIDELAEGIAKDQSLAARALRVANSPFYGIQHRVASIHDAIVILGFRAVGSLVTAASVTGYFSPPPGVAFDHAEFWRHGIGAALCARHLGGMAGFEPETAFTAGLLHDIGILTLLTAVPAHYAEVLNLRQQEDCEVRQAETRLLGFDHARVGAALAERWRFPPEIVHAVAMHHDPGTGREAGDAATLADVIHLANVLAHALDLSGARDALTPALDAGAWRRLGIDGARLKAAFAAIEREHACYSALLVG